MSLREILARLFGSSEVGNAGKPRRGDNRHVGGSGAVEPTFHLERFTPDDGEGSGFVAVRVSNGDFVSWKDYPADSGLESIEVVGESYHMDGLQDLGFKPGSRVWLVPEPTNPYDRNAVAVFSHDRQSQAGYIPTEEAPRMLRRIKEGGFTSYVVWETRDRKNFQRNSIRLLLVGDSASAEWED